ncbi:CheR family methyltransferase [Massilia putida]|uniref:CheR family methyltransferase n=1 Tax=Massilia putida TaxID=1141883 RepID=UPI000AD747C0|nr:protein-glutamate O-methyltransferase CheR [Massilia putida]
MIGTDPTLPATGVPATGVPATGVPATDVLALAAQRVEAETGLTFPGTRRRQFDAALGRMAEALGLPGAAACASWLLAGPWDAARSALCARFLTIGETYFFREPRALDLVCDVARAHLARGETRLLRIWSAGCCTGEEPYSIAMTLRRCAPRLLPDGVTILATDLNDAFLDFARAGRYRRWSFRRTDPADLDEFFRPLGDGRFEIDPQLRAAVRFASLNLASGAYPSSATGTPAQDVIFCRNVLMYFGQEQARRVIARMRDCLVDGGWLVVNASEASTSLFAGFTPVYQEDAVFFRKSALPAPADVPAKAPAAAPVAFTPAPEPAPAPAPAFAPTPAPAPRRDDAMARVHALADAGRREEALQGLRRAVEADALSAPLQQDAALFALEHDDRALARQCVRRLLYLEPDSAIGHYLSALIEDAAGRRPRARILLREFGRLAPGADAELRGALRQWMERAS